MVAVCKRSGILHHSCAHVCHLSQHCGVDTRGVYARIIGEHGLLVGLLKREIAAALLDQAVANEKPLDVGLLQLAQV